MIEKYFITGKTIGIKVGSSLLTKPEGGVSVDYIDALCRMISLLISWGNKVFLVTSGAIASCPIKYGALSGGLKAGIGWGELSPIYLSTFAKYGIASVGLLGTKRDIVGCYELIDDQRKQYKFVEPVFISNIICYLDLGMAVFLNNHDVVDNYEVMMLENKFADNDYFFEHMCLSLRPDFALIGSDKKASIDPANSALIHRLTKDNFEFMQSINQGGNKRVKDKSGGAVKTEVIRNLAAAGIPAIIASGKDKLFILKALASLVAKSCDYGTCALPEDF